MTDLRELDARLAGLLGWTVVEARNSKECYELIKVYMPGKRMIWKSPKGEHFIAAPFFSSHPRTMLKLDAEMQRRGYYLTVARMHPEHWEAMYSRLETDCGAGIHHGATMPEAVARAALSALKAERGEGE